MKSLETITVDSIRESLLGKEFSAVALTKLALLHAETENPKTNAYLTFCPDRALAAAQEVDRKIAAGDDPGPLAGVPVAVKDNKWNDAIRIGDVIMREFPNTRIAQEVREKMDLLRKRATEPTAAAAT